MALMLLSIPITTSFKSFCFNLSSYFFGDGHKLVIKKSCFIQDPERSTNIPIVSLSIEIVVFIIPIYEKNLEKDDFLPEAAFTLQSRSAIATLPINFIIII